MQIPEKKSNTQMRPPAWLVYTIVILSPIAAWVASLVNDRATDLKESLKDSKELNVMLINTLTQNNITQQNVITLVRELNILKNEIRLVSYTDSIGNSNSRNKPDASAKR
jgi:hypothetical protein